MIKDVFGTNRPLIGALHFPPLPGFEGYTSMDEILKFSLKNAKILEEAGFDAIIVENNYDIPHKITVGKETVTAMKELTKEIGKCISIPVGVSVLWNSYREAFEIAKESRATFIRVPVFVDDVKTSYGTVLGDAEDVISARKEQDAENVLIFTDIQVKHAKLLNKRPVSESARDAAEKGSDGLIITGKWTGDAPKTDDLRSVRSEVGNNFPVIIGSGATDNNIKILLKYASGVIVGTALKDTEETSREIHVNLVGPYIPISKQKSISFVKSFKEAL